VVEITRADLREHAALRAWRMIRPGGAEPAGIAILRKSEKSSVYRLDGIGPGGSSLVAKRCRIETALIERLVYEDVLPCLPITTLTFHGCVGDNESHWLFVEYAGGVRFSAGNEAHRALASRWLALMHTAATRLPLADALPDRGPGHYVEQLRCARETIRRNLENPALRSSDRGVLESIVAQCDALESRWCEVEARCAGLPRTLVHGDFRPKNVYIRAEQVGMRLFAIDWEMAGWGVPAVDLASARGPRVELIDVPTYMSVARESWRTLDAASLRTLLAVGLLFRRLDAINWDAVRLATPWPQRAMEAMRVYRAELAGFVGMARWAL
jgi:aminoglycoside phosphotransferase (APT) family kinase protein